MDDQFRGASDGDGRADTGGEGAPSPDPVEAERRAAMKRLHTGGATEQANLARRRFPVHSIRPCVSIPDQDDSRSHSSIKARYALLESDLPLAGTLAMRPTVEGGMHLIEQILATAPWYAPAIDVIGRQLDLSVWAGRPWLQWRPMVIAGPSGIGKSHFARLIAGTVGSRPAVINAGGLDDVRMLAGTARGWRNSQPAWPAMVMAQHGVANPVLVVEEIDKVDRVNGDAVIDTLLAMLDPGTARRYYDSCLTAEVDLSACCWILTVNDLGRLPPPLLSRVDVVVLKGPQPEHFPLVLEALLDALGDELGVARTWLPVIPVHAVQVFAAEFARRRSIRLLRRRVQDAVAVLLPPPERAH